jgi:hypothetical protein
MAYFDEKKAAPKSAIMRTPFLGLMDGVCVLRTWMDCD